MLTTPERHGKGVMRAMDGDLRRIDAGTSLRQATALAVALTMVGIGLGAGTTPVSGDHYVEREILSHADLNFGVDANVDGDYLVVGARLGNGLGPETGTAHVYERDGAWNHVATLTAADGALGDFFGSSVAISGDWIVVGADSDDDLGSKSGSAYVFHRGDGIWSQTQKLVAADGAAEDRFGYRVGISGDQIIIAAPFASPTAPQGGSAYVFSHQPDDTWVQSQQLAIVDATGGALLGVGLDIQGDRIALGAPHERPGGLNSGAGYVFERGGAGVWTLAATLSNGDAALGDQLGSSAAIDDDFVVFGAERKNAVGANSGSAYVYRRDGGGNWGQEVRLLAEETTGGDRFGHAVAIEGTRVMVGAPHHDILAQGPRSGGAYLFSRDGSGAWTQNQAVQARFGDSFHQFGFALDLQGDQLVSGTAVGEVIIFRINLAPSAVIEAIPAAECFAGGQEVTVDGSNSMDSEQDSLSFLWSAPGITFDDAGAAVTSAWFPLGSTAVTLAVTDEHGEEAEATETVTVVDTLPPTLFIESPQPGYAYVLEQGTSHGEPSIPIVAVGPLTVFASAEDDCLLTHVAFASSTGETAIDAEPGYRFTSHPGPLGSGEVTVSATAVDVSGATATAAVSFVQLGTAT